MNDIAIEILRDTLNRSAKIDVDNGSAPDFATAVERLGRHHVSVVVGPEIAVSAAHQAALLTTVNIARRFALGGVSVSGPTGGPLLVLQPGERSLEAEIVRLGGRLGAPFEGAPTVVIGEPPDVHNRGISVTFSGWRGAIVPYGSARLDDKTSVAPSAVLAGALAAGEAFAMLRGDVEAGRRSIGLSLWRPDSSFDWRISSSDGPVLACLPDRLWVLGLGHIGQAFLWTLACCPYADRGRVCLFLQDVDAVTGSTESTSILTESGMVRTKKTRAIANVLERFGFATNVIERAFDGNFARREDDPPVLVCGVDNALARSRLELPNFPMVVEAGIGHTAQDFRALRVHTFPGERRAAKIWKASARNIDEVLRRPAYRRLSDAGEGICGLTQLAETAVGAPFVGAVAGTLMLAQILRVLASDNPDAVVNADLKSFSTRRAVRNAVLAPFNPGYQSVASSAPAPD